MSTFLRVKREEMGVSLRDMASRLGISAAYLSDIERGNRTVPLGRKLEICRQYGASDIDAFVSVPVRFAYQAKEEPDGDH